MCGISFGKKAIKSDKIIQIIINCYSLKIPLSHSLQICTEQNNNNGLHTNTFTHQQFATCNYQRVVFYCRIFSSGFAPGF